ncbi:MAG: ribonuclease P protein component [Bacteroides sp.]|nr:ribonuclease P protein component [Roseburia sp.]MCM1347143.1 ribonuclease P protein component [Bacteroides sp.]MCM1420613.1 ribonuclease P protein component [Bacteroides sp.]
METVHNTFCKAERLNKKLIIEKLFAGGNASMSAYPLRALYMPIPKGEVPVSILISVPKRKLHHATDRNRIKRQIREAYRRSKHTLWNILESKGQSMAVAFICLSDKPCTTSDISKSVRKILRRIEERTV